MSATDIWLTIGLLTLATILTRCSFFLLGNTLKLPASIQHALRYAPAAALAAVVVPDLVLSPSHEIALTWMNAKLLAGIGAILFFVWTRHMLGTIVIGMVFFTILRLSLPT